MCSHLDRGQPRIGRLAHLELDADGNWIELRSHLRDDPLAGKTHGELALCRLRHVRAHLFNDGLYQRLLQEKKNTLSMKHIPIMPEE